jgi:prophage antirepressor-like protein
MTNLIESIDINLSFKDNTVRVLGSIEEPLFVVKDVCKILGLSNTTETLRNVDDDYHCSVELNGGMSTGIQTTSVVKEPGLYQIIMRCRKEIAKPFQRWVCSEVLPSLRKKGEYKMKEEYQTKLEQIKLENEEKDKIIKDSKKILRNNVTEIKALRKLVKKQKKADDKKAEIKNLLYLIQIGNENKLGKTSNFNTEECINFVKFSTDFIS